MNTEALEGHSLGKNTRRALVVTSGAANTSAIENTRIQSRHGGRETEIFEQGEEGKIYLYLKSSGGPNDLSLTETDWGQWLRRSNRFGLMVPSIVLMARLSPPDFGLQSPVAALSRGFLEECLEGTARVGETACSASVFNVEQDFETRDSRGIFALSHAKKVIFSQEMELKTAQLPRWKPHVTIDLHRLERGNE